MNANAAELRLAHRHLRHAQTELKLARGLIEDPAIEIGIREFCDNQLDSWAWKVEAAIRRDQTVTAG